MTDRNAQPDEPEFGNLADWNTDPEKARSGVALDMGDGRALIVRRAGLQNREFLAGSAELKHTGTPRDVGSAEGIREQHALYARTVVVGWVGINDKQGEPIEFSPERCVRLFEYAPELFERVWMFAIDRGNYRTKELAEDREALKG